MAADETLYGLTVDEVDKVCAMDWALQRLRRSANDEAKARENLRLMAKNYGEAVRNALTPFLPTLNDALAAEFAKERAHLAAVVRGEPAAAAEEIRRLVGAVE